MSDLIHRCEKVQAVVADLSLPKGQRVNDGLTALSGLILSDLTEQVRTRFEGRLVSVQSMFDQYQLKSGDGFERIVDAELEQLLGILSECAANAISDELDRIVAALDAAKSRFPEAEIREAREHRERMIPRLIDVLTQASAAARAGDGPNGNAHFVALFLLSEFGAQEAFPAILEAITLPGRLPHDLFGDAVTDGLDRILAQFAGDRPEILDALIRDPAVDLYVRWVAAEAYVFLVRDERLAHEEAVERLRQHFRDAMEADDAQEAEGVEFVSSLVIVLDHLGAAAALPDIEEAYRRDLVAPYMIDLESIRESIAEGDAYIRTQLNRCSPTGIKDALGELRDWLGMNEPPAPRPAPRPAPIQIPPRHETSAGTEPSLAALVSSGGKPISRSGPCPCGSGKKYKKCCEGRL